MTVFVLKKKLEAKKPEKKTKNVTILLFSELGLYRGPIGAPPYH